VKNINSFFHRDRLNAQRLLKKVRAKARGHASKNLTEFRGPDGAQHTNRFRFAAIDSSANNEWVRLGLSFTAADISTLHADLPEDTSIPRRRKRSSLPTENRQQIPETRILAIACFDAFQFFTLLTADANPLHRHTILSGVLNH
jgi:hypothetical protein